MSTPNRFNPRGMRVVLVLQGGGALGAYQAGVYQALHECGLAPDWIVGTSIGAINGALIAGNREPDRVARLKEFWDMVSHPDNFDMSNATEALLLANVRVSTSHTFLHGVPGFFAPRPFNPFAAGMKVDPAEAAFYDTRPLNDTLSRLADFDYLNSAAAMRLSSSAVNVVTGELDHFDNRVHTLTPDHIRASGALPPGLPPVEVEGALYWDGGLYSNTPLECVLSEAPEGDTLCFLVDLWSAGGEAPTTLDEVQTRVKDVTFASRSMRHIGDYAVRHAMQDKLRELYERLPEEERTEQDRIDLERLGCDTTLHIVRVPYSGVDWRMASKDVNFSRGSIAWRWEQGYLDGQRALGDARWLVEVESDRNVVVHDLPPREGGEVAAGQPA